MDLEGWDEALRYESPVEKRRKTRAPLPTRSGAPRYKTGKGEERNARGMKQTELKIRCYMSSYKSKSFDKGNYGAPRRRTNFKKAEEAIGPAASAGNSRRTKKGGGRRWDGDPADATVGKPRPYQENV